MADHFEQILKRRVVPDSASNLAERIIDAARPRPVRAQGSFDPAGWIGAFMRGFALPQPALAMAVILIAGVTLGFYVGDASASEKVDLSVPYVEDGFQTGEWL